MRPHELRPHEFGVTFTATDGYTRFLAAAVASLRSHNDKVPLRCIVSRDGAEEFGGIADAFDVAMVVGGPHAADATSVSAGRREWVDSRLAKIGAIADPAFDPFLYLDSDILVYDDIENLRVELEPRLAEQVDIFMLLRRPGRWTLWGDRANYFVDPAISREDALRCVNDSFGVDLPEACLDEMDCWNSGVIFGRADALRQVGERWLDLYRTMLAADGGRSLIPRDSSHCGSHCGSCAPP